MGIKGGGRDIDNVTLRVPIDLYKNDLAPFTQ